MWKLSSTCDVEFDRIECCRRQSWQNRLPENDFSPLYFILSVRINPFHTRRKHNQKPRNLVKIEIRLRDGLRQSSEPSSPWRCCARANACDERGTGCAWSGRCGGASLFTRHKTLFTLQFESALSLVAHFCQSSHSEKYTKEKKKRKMCLDNMNTNMRRFAHRASVVVHGTRVCALSSHRKRYPYTLSASLNRLLRLTHTYSRKRRKHTYIACLEFLSLVMQLYAQL